MTSQVSDVSVTTAQMRRTTLAHGILSFVFNIAVLAMSINVIGGVIVSFPLNQPRHTPSGLAASEMP